ncbi:GNAT family N-acetyltransferase [Eleftheria terrae]|uniref:GNAT family N-acetyltransferase n=1 Tax=Eleftheria terrae TaxID=1597781 RepID=UPI00263AB93C|nr:N-acetyltransferase [Eleftheria terrae]WKB53900.1 N-acetyltransferase [Eleftheria terrae]
MPDGPRFEMRPETQADVAAIEAVTIAAFRDVGHSSHTEHHIIRALRASGELLHSWVAEERGQIIGHVALSPVTVSDGSAGWYGLGPVSVRPGYQGRGVGSRLVLCALSALRAQGAAGCVVLGEPRYYSRFGFRAEPALRLPGVPAEYFMAMALHGAMASGTVSYSPAFDARR